MVHGQLSAISLELIEGFRRAGILQDVNAHRIDQSQGAIIVSCADGDQMHDLFHHHATLFLKSNAVPRLHTLALNGGALLLPVTSPLNRQFREDEVLLHHINVAQKLKEINTVVLYAHAPCGAAAMHNMSFLQVIEYLIQAKMLLKKSGPAGIKVACFIHIDYDGDKKRTYFVSRELFNKVRPNQKTSK